jgi:hypothetical protein
MPWEVNDYFRKIGVEIDKQGYYLGDRENISDLIKIENAVTEGKMPVIFENHLLTATREKNILYRLAGVHFITIHDFKVDEKNDLVNYSYWDYGSVQNKRYVFDDSYPGDATNLRQAMKMARKAEKRKKVKVHEQVTIHEFLKAMKGYWIPARPAN